MAVSIRLRSAAAMFLREGPLTGEKIQDDCPGNFVAVSVTVPLLVTETSSRLAASGLAARWKRISVWLEL